MKIFSTLKMSFKDWKLVEQVSNMSPLAPHVPSNRCAESIQTTMQKSKFYTRPTPESSVSSYLFHLMLRGQTALFGSGVGQLFLTRILEEAGNGLLYSLQGSSVEPMLELRLESRFGTQV